MRPVGHRVILTRDGSSSVVVTGFFSGNSFSRIPESYHSHSGAMSETRQIYIEKGLVPVLSGNIGKSGDNSLSILEVGWGTGLNMLLTLDFLVKSFRSFGAAIKARYIALEPYPLSMEVVGLLNYREYISPSLQEFFEESHRVSASKSLYFRKDLIGFEFSREECCLEDFSTEDKFDLVYFDAFAPQKTRAIWELSNFLFLYRRMVSGGILISYSAADIFHSNLLAAGFKTERLKGALAKREMLRGIR